MLAAASVAAVGCSGAAGSHRVAVQVPVEPVGHARAPAAGDAGAGSSDWSVPAPGTLRAAPLPPRLVVVSERRLPARMLRRARTVPGVRAAVPMSLASMPVDGRTLTLAAGNPAQYRRFVPAHAARTRAVWLRAAAGEVVLAPTVATQLRQALGEEMLLGSGPGAVALRVGAFSPMPQSVDAFVNQRLGVRLGMTVDNAMMVAAPRTRLEQVSRGLRAVVGDRAAVYPLVQPVTDGASRATRTRPEEAVPQVGAAVLSGGSVAQAVGSFRYRYLPDGTVQPDPDWVAANIRTEQVPILGAVTCHRVMLPRLRWALREMVDRGLGHSIDPGDFGGCYVPRFIGYAPTNGLSLHTWGIAVDLNVSTNQRGSVGAIDPVVVDVFKKWGFAWGGDWAYTDPMHFELAVLTRPASSG